MAKRRLSPARIVTFFLIGFVIIFPLLNQGGIINIYEAIAGIWAVFLIPAFLLYRTLSKSGGKKAALKFSAVLYVGAASLYSLVEPLIAGYDLGSYVYLILIPASLIIMMPSIYIWYKGRHARERPNLQIDETLTASLRAMLAGYDDNPPEVFIRSGDRKLGANFVTHTDGPNPKIGIFASAKGIYDEKEINAAILREYFDLKNRVASRFVITINLLIMMYLDGIVILSQLARVENSNILGLVFVGALGVLVFGFIGGFPALLKMLTFRKESGSDEKAARYMKDIDPLKSLILKGAENYIISPMATSRRAERMMVGQSRLADRRVKALESLESEIRAGS